MYDEGVRTFIEVGPRSNLTAFVEDCLRGRDFLALASNRERISDLEQIQHLLARLFVNRVNVNLKPLYSGRGLRIVSWEEEDSEINSPKTSSVLELNVPTMRLQPDVVEAIQSTLLSENKDREANSQEFRENGSDTATPRTREPIQNSIAQTHKPTQQLKQPDPRLSILLGHFDLMQEFLASQQRVATSLYSPQTPNSELGFAEAWPLLGRVIENSNGKLYCQKQFNIDRDIFLQDHTLGGTLSVYHPELLPLPIIPFTVSMEAIAEAAAYLVGGQKKVISCYNLRGYRWLALDRGTLNLDIVAQLLSETRPDISDVYVQLFQSEGDRLLVFEGCVRLGDRFPSPPQPIPFDLSEPPQPSRFTDETLYSTGMFHKPRLRGVNRIRQWTKKGIEADLQVISTHDFFSDTRRPVLQTDAGLLDAVGQLVGYWVSEQFGFDFNVFPYHVEAVHLYADQLPANFPLLGRGIMHFTSEEFTEANLDMIDNSGNVIARIEGWKDRYFAVPSHYYQCRLYPNIAYLSSSFLPESGVICRRIDPLPEGFLDNSWGIWKRALAHLMLNHNERDVWYELPEKGWCQTEWLLERIAAKDAVRQWAKQRLNLDLAPVDIELATTDAGKLFVSCPELASISPLPDVSVSYSNGYAIAAVGEPGTRVGIVLEWLEGDEARFKAAFDPQELAIPASLDTRERKRAIAAVWCAKQAAAKAIGAGVQDNLKHWKISNYSPERIGITHAKTTFYVKLWQTDREIVAICQHSI